MAPVSPRWVKGDTLSLATQADARRRFAHRHTKEHKPNWPRYDATLSPVQFASDADWLAHTTFAVRLNGQLDGRVSYCYSTPTWPDNPELRRASPGSAKLDGMDLSRLLGDG